MAGAVALVELALGEASRKVKALRERALKLGLGVEVHEAHASIVEAERIAAQARMTIQGVRAPVQMPALSDLQADMMAEHPETESALEATYAGAAAARVHRPLCPDRRMRAAGDHSLEEEGDAAECGPQPQPRTHC
jgi:hypothetical protein